MNLDQLKEKMLLFSNNQDKLTILKSLNENSVFLDLTFIDPIRTLTEFKTMYFSYMYKNYKITYDLANKIKKYFDYIDIKKTYTSKKLTNIKKIKEDLLANEIIKEFNFNKYLNFPVASVNKMPIPSLFKSHDVTELSINDTCSKEIVLSVASNIESTCYNVYERVVELLEERIDISKIVILNSTGEDDFHLQKLFNDANIAISFNKSIKLNTHPSAIMLLEIYKQEGYSASKRYLDKLITEKPNNFAIKPLLDIFNTYPDKAFIDYPDLLLSLVNTTSIKPVRYSNCVNIYSYKDVFYDNQTYYLLMNYTDNNFPNTTRFSGYLNNAELNEIGYVSEDKYNVYLENQDINILNKIENLSLFFSKRSDTENRIARLDLDREILQEEYEYKIKTTTYLNSLNQLEFSKTKYDYDNFFLRQANYGNLFNSYNNVVKEYKHDYSGVLKQDLDYLLKKRNTLTGAKVEAYNLSEESIGLIAIMTTHPIVT